MAKLLSAGYYRGVTATANARRLVLLIILLWGDAALVAAQSAPGGASASPSSTGASGTRGTALPGTASGSAVQPTVPSGSGSAAPTGLPSAPAAPAKNAPRIQVSEGGSTLSPGATLTIPDTPLGVESKPLQFAIDNSGDAPLVLDEFAPPQLDGDGSLFYLLDLSTLTMTIDPGNSTSFAVSFFPAFLGKEEVTLVITSNDPSTPVFSVDISSAGITNPAFNAQ